MSNALVSFYSAINNRFAYTGYVDDFAVLPYTAVLFDPQSGLLKPIFNQTSQLWEESATYEELNPHIEESTILETLCIEHGIPFTKGTEIQYDTLSFLKPKEAVYGLKGAKLYKDYVYLKEGVETLVIRQVYSEIVEEKRDGDLSTEVITGLNKTILFYKETQSPIEKKMSTLDFNVFPVVTQTPVTGDPLLLYSSSKLEQYLETQRYKADSMLKSFNPNLYNWLYLAYGDLYQGYLKTGNSSPLKEAFINETDSLNTGILNKVVEEQFLVLLLGQMETYPQLKVRDLIEMNLQ